MTCSITIIRRGKPVAEVKGVEVGEPLYDDIEELKRLRDEVEALEIGPYIHDDEQFEIDVESTLLDLYEKIGYLKQRVERLENERRS